MTGLGTVQTGTDEVTETTTATLTVVLVVAAEMITDIRSTEEITTVIIFMEITAIVIKIAVLIKTVVTKIWAVTQTLVVTEMITRVVETLATIQGSMTEQREDKMTCIIHTEELKFQLGVRHTVSSKSSSELLLN